MTDHLLLFTCQEKTFIKNQKFNSIQGDRFNTINALALNLKTTTKESFVSKLITKLKNLKLQF